MATVDRPKRGRGSRVEEASGYVQPGRVGKKPLVGYFDKEAHKAVKQLAVELDRKVEDLMREAFCDLLLKLGKREEARRFERKAR